MLLSRKIGEKFTESFFGVYGFLGVIMANLSPKGNHNKFLIYSYAHKNRGRNAYVWVDTEISD